tara:strand:+ start:344 stop:448 length:105 start_codon:yes stop_codon:yes gene_type:complete
MVLAYKQGDNLPTATPLGITGKILYNWKAKFDDD